MTPYKFFVAYYSGGVIEALAPSLEAFKKMVRDKYPEHYFSIECWQVDLRTFCPHCEVELLHIFSFPGECPQCDYVDLGSHS